MRNKISVSFYYPGVWVPTDPAQPAFGRHEVEPERYDASVSIDELADKFIEWYPKARPRTSDDIREVEKKDHEAWRRFFLQFVPDAQAAEANGREVKLNDPNPTRDLNSFVVRGNLGWLTVYIFPDIWLFFRREGKQYQRVPIPENCVVADDGAITAEYAGHTFQVRPRWSGTETFHDEAWPWMLLNPNQWVVHQQILNLLESSNVNPLSGLLRSPQPVKTLAHQLKGRIEELHNMLLGTLTKV